MGVNYKISVILLAYNHEKTIAKAIESILHQKTYFNFEILIGDDCSSDDTAEIANEYAKKNPNVVLIRRDNNIGATANLSDLIECSSGEYITTLEGDDYWTDMEKLHKQVLFLDKNADFFFCGGKHQCIDENGVVISDQLKWIAKTQTFSFSKYNGIKLPCHPNTYMFRSAIKEDVKALNDIHRNVADRSLTALLLYHGKCYVFENVMLSYRCVQKNDCVNLTSLLYNGQEMHFYTDYLIAKKTRLFFKQKYKINPVFKLLIPRILLKTIVKLCISPNAKRLKCLMMIVKDMTRNEK